MRQLMHQRADAENEEKQTQRARTISLRASAREMRKLSTSSSEMGENQEVQNGSDRCFSKNKNTLANVDKSSRALEEKEHFLNNLPQRLAIREAHCRATSLKMPTRARVSKELMQEFKTTATGKLAAT